MLVVPNRLNPQREVGLNPPAATTMKVPTPRISQSPTRKRCAYNAQSPCRGAHISEALCFCECSRFPIFKLYFLWCSRFIVFLMCVGFVLFAALNLCEHIENRMFSKLCEHIEKSDALTRNKTIRASHAYVDRGVAMRTLWDDECHTLDTASHILCVL